MAIVFMNSQQLWLLYKICIRTSQPKFWHRWGGGLQVTSLIEELLAVSSIFGNEQSLFFVGTAAGIFLCARGCPHTYAHVGSANLT